jgi:hypothetical protein
MNYNFLIRISSRKPPVPNTTKAEFPLEPASSLALNHSNVKQLRKPYAFHAERLYLHVQTSLANTAKLNKSVSFRG